MVNRTTGKREDITINQGVNAFIKLDGTSLNQSKKNPFIETLTSEGGENFVNYIRSIGLDRDPNPVVLSSLHHYFYDADEMKHVKTVINLKELNQMKEIKSFLHSIFHILPQKSNFIGCFIDNDKINGYVLRKNLTSSSEKKSFDDIENGIVSRIPFLNMLYSIMDSKTNRYMSQRSVSLLLNDHGFKVLDMKEQNGITFFHAQKNQISGN
jgi:hypothetical protein